MTDPQSELDVEGIRAYLHRDKWGHLTTEWRTGTGERVMVRVEELAALLDALEKVGREKSEVEEALRVLVDASAGWLSCVHSEWDGVTDQSEDDAILDAARATLLPTPITREQE